MKPSPYSNDEYTIGWISALNDEFMVAMAMLDEEHGRPQSTPRDDTNAYHLGKIGEHNVVMACLSGGQAGTGPAAIVAENMRRTFKNIRFALLVGIGGGVPGEKKDVRLGDVVVSYPSGIYTGVVQYDYGKLMTDGQIQRKDWFCAPPRKVLAAVDLLRAYHSRPKKPINNMPEIIDELGEEYAYPDEQETPDILYRASHEHRHRDKVETEEIIQRRPRKSPGNPTIHYGIIASGNMVIKSGIERDKIDQRYENSILCFEMEAAGLMNNFPCLVVRGISDYSDSHKNDHWRNRAIVVASAYAKELLSMIEPSDVEVLPPIAARVLETVSLNIAKIDESTNENTKLLQKAAEETRRTQQHDLHMQCENWLKPPNVREIQQDQVQKSVLGTCDWIWSNTTFIRWYAAPILSPPDGLMCIYGPPGCGKSILASSMADHLWKKEVFTLFFAFSGMHASHQKSTGLIRSLLWQLLELAPDDQNTSVLQSAMLRGQPTTSDLWVAFSKMATIFSKPVYCIVDGVDESTDPTELFRRVLEFLEGHPNFRFIFLGRQHAFQGINCIRHYVEIQPALTKSDIDTVIETGINQSKILCLPELREEVTRSLRGKSDGNFLWVKLMFGHLNKSLKKADVLKRLQNLPRDLEAAYEALFTGLLSKLEPDELELAQRVFAFVIASQRPLNLDELQHLLSVHAMSTCTCNEHSIDDHLILQLNSRISSVCGDLIYSMNGCLQLVHFSVKEFLLRPKTQWSCRRSGRKIMRFRVLLEDTHGWFAAACIEYLGICDYGSPLHDWEESTKLAHYHFLRYSSTYIVTHTYQSGLPSNYLLEKIDKFVTSERWIAWLELFYMNAIQDESLHARDDELRNFTSWLGDHSEKLFHTTSTNLALTIEKRTKEYGQDDPRTEHLRVTLGFWNHIRVFLGLSEDLSSSINAGIVRSCAVQSTASPPNVLPILQKIRQNAPLSLRLQVDLVLRMQAHLLNVKRLTDPLQTIFRMILQKASVMPVYILLLVGDFYYKVDKYEQAVEVFFAAVRKLEKKETREKFQALHMMGKSYSNLNQNDRALEQFQYALEGRERKLGSEHKDTLYTLFWIGTTYQELGQFDNALECLKKALKGEEKMFGPEHEETLWTLHRIGTVYYDLDQFDDALEYLKKALAGRAKVLGPEHKETLSTLHLIGTTYQELDQFDNALEYLKKALAGQEKISGPEDEEALWTLYGLGITYQKLGQFDNALECLKKALKGQENISGPEDEETLQTLHRIGTVYYNLGQFDNALECLKRALVGQEEILDPLHPDILSTLYSIGRTYQELNRFEDSLEYLKKVLAGQGKTLGPDHERTLHALKRMVIAYAELEGNEDDSDFEGHDSESDFGYRSYSDAACESGRRHSSVDLRGV